jgi:soluble lytic murein transglycosylase-like protein
MKFVVLALFLGCSAIAVRIAGQSHFIHPDPRATTEFPLLRAALDRLRFGFPQAELQPAASAPTGDSPGAPLKPIPLLPKAQTLTLIAAAAAKHNVPAAFVQSIVAAESNFNCAAISPKGAIGLMQLMPETAEQFGADPMIPEQNIDAGTRYLRALMNRYQNSRSSLHRVIAAYNAGPGMVDRYHGIPPFRETRCYVTRVLAFFKQFGGSHNHPAFRQLMARDVHSKRVR